MPQNTATIDRRRRSLLILECDTDKLASQNLSVGDFVYETAYSFFPTNPIELIKIDKESDLLDAFTKSSQTNKKYKNIFLIGHSNQSEVQLASDRSVSWKGLAQWLEPFQPKQLTFLACQAVNISSCGMLFEELDSLNEIFGSPINVNTKQSIIALFNNLITLADGKAESSALKMAQIANFILTKGVTFHYTRKDYEKYDSGEIETWNFIENNLPKIKF